MEPGKCNFQQIIFRVAYLAWIFEEKSVSFIISSQMQIYAFGTTAVLQCIPISVKGRSLA